MASADDLLGKFWDGELPVDPARIAIMAGCDVVPLDPVPPAKATCDHMASNGLCGMVEVRDGRVVIYYSTLEDGNRQRFAIAHALGHAVLGHANHSAPLRDHSANFSLIVQDCLERQANDFAISLLVPKAAIANVINGWRVPLELDALAKVFDVAPVAMRARLKDLGLMDY